MKNKKIHPHKRPSKCGVMGDETQQRPFPFRSHVCNRIRELTLSLWQNHASPLLYPRYTMTQSGFEHVRRGGRTHPRWNSCINKPTHLLQLLLSMLRNSITTTNTDCIHDRFAHNQRRGRARKIISGVRRGYPNRMKSRDPELKNFLKFRLQLRSCLISYGSGSGSGSSSR